MEGWGVYIQPQEEVQKFLDYVHMIIRSDGFDPFEDIDYSPKSARQDKGDRNTTANTLARLEYDKSDIANEVLTLTPCNYEKTCVDHEPRLPDNYCFYKKIANEDIIIKFRETDKGSKRFFFLSFHSSDRPIELDRYRYWNPVGGNNNE